MELLEQCQKWNENDEHQKIIDALEAIPAGERTPEMDSELARACENIAQPGERALFEKAIALLTPHEAYFEGDHCWNYRMGYAYYYLDQDGPALRYFEQALEARPGDEDTQELIDDCRGPVFRYPTDFWGFLRSANRPRKLGPWRTYPETYPDLPFFLPGEEPKPTQQCADSTLY